MIGCDARDATDDEWLALAREWRSSFVALVRENVEAALGAAGVPRDAPIVGAGCGSFLVRECAAGMKRRYVEFADVVAAAPEWRDGAGLCAPAVAVAILRTSNA
jgi:uncharacterized hydantoinase/oxoprolinase family protein